jgi:FkbM family methyltransferase
MNRYGTIYGGWNIPKDIVLTNDSIIYSVGVGEDISFDILMQKAHNLNIVLIDPTERAFTHYKEIQQYYQTNKAQFTGDIQQDYIRTIHNSKPDFEKFKYIKTGLWSHKDVLKFYKPLNEKYVSHTFIENMYSNDYDNVEVDSLKNIMVNLGHTHIDILKLDIEGSEIVVLDQMVEDGIFPKYICVEFDLKLKNVDHKNETKIIIDKLINSGYKMIDNDNWNCLFVKLY